MANGHIPLPDPNYPLYALSFDTNAPVKEKEGAFRQQIPGSHRLVVATGGRKIRISYEHNDPQNDRKPILNVLIEDIGADGSVPLGSPGRERRKQPAKKPKAPTKKAAKTSTKKTKKAPARAGAAKKASRRRG
jgi:hypothetical protein